MLCQSASQKQILRQGFGCWQFKQPADPKNTGSNTKWGRNKKGPDTYMPESSLLQWTGASLETLQQFLLMTGEVEVFLLRSSRVWTFRHVPPARLYTEHSGMACERAWGWFLLIELSTGSPPAGQRVSSTQATEVGANPRLFLPTGYFPVDSYDFFLRWGLKDSL